jgi:PAS domain S-box-containing protein
VRADEALAVSEEQFRLLVSGVQDYAIFMLDPSGRVVSWNRGAQRIQGYTADEIVGQHFRIFYPRDKQLQRHPEHELRVALREGRYEEEGWRIRKDGTSIWASVVITALHDDQGRHVGFAKVTRDMTERRQMMLDREDAAAALAASNAELEGANRRLAGDAADLAQFLAVTAHELRNPVSVLTGSSELLAQHWAQMGEDERASLLESVTSSSQRLQRMVADLLTVSRLDSNAVHLRRVTLAVDALLTQAAARARASNPALEITVRCPPEHLTIRADPDRLGQAVDNLVVNAARHGAPPVELTARTSGDRVEIRVRDHGPGITEPMRERLFQRFASGGPGKGGTGLGLFIVRELARMHGGDAWHAPSPGPGAVFVLSLPRADAP